MFRASGLRYILCPPVKLIVQVGFRRYRKMGDTHQLEPLKGLEIGIFRVFVTPI